MSIRLIEVTAESFDEAIGLEVADNQNGFVASNLMSIAQSKFFPTLRTEAVFDGEAMVGFVMYGFDPEESRFVLARLMIDKKHQGKGYGRSATEAVIERLKEEDGCNEVYLSFVPENSAAASLYESVGFIRTGEIDEKSGEIVMKYELRMDNG